MGKAELKRELSMKEFLWKALIYRTTVGKGSIVNTHYFNIIGAVSHSILMFIVLTCVS